MAEVTTEAAAPKEAKTKKKYRCTEKCFWCGTLYYEGDTVDVPADVVPPEWFDEIKVR